MAPPRKHDTDVILDAARALVLAEGPRAASVSAIADASGAPVGTLYHRFGNRNGVLTAAWIRALERFQDRVKAAAEEPDPVAAGVAMARAAIGFGRDLPEDARLLLSLRPSDLLDGSPDEEFGTRLAGMNAPLIEQLRRIASGVTGGAGDRELDAVSRAIVDLPYAALRRHAHAPELPEWLEHDVTAAARTLLESLRAG
ncbi:TetR/AcrR family transcriptional regulator [Nocardia cyriacigeorgica]|uniref:Bacterial regulatory proteins, tetR family n=1 Tax=Nocardia cyriacigeorgica TaxID=135487 RepID=A0A4U8W765_9NOCA|nr:TetR/AcrR family transcriptional regulator [Nocardia cyriacigeorgica]MBF6101129.1 TetR/AcrR family transcriptional regulator [Nocardia cyriacigeorgica]MBF6160542.1 TetR/AcrR family transcriptional regulator [Nocardia cyriacigeorgica]MBF6199691.1 TetR/AcrR family transcriptional regulator [Nocardia cyriacigeorgica]MBF6320012.1 TetR/AcrR family transcriptional regulator [Nocardia cyriacigeorgica]MBF6517131.1 TetR/AcrR family transcriptional regulator [Nocardia cyriacigeorgica]